MSVNGSEPKVRIIPLKSLFVDHRYQRDLNERQVAKMVKAWDPRLAGLLEVSDRGKAKMAVFDGQHRLAAMRQLGHTEAMCLVHENLGERGEAELFASLQLKRKQLTPLERFKAQVFARDEDALAILAAVEGAGFAVGKMRDGKPSEENHIAAVMALELVYRRGGGDLLSGALTLIRDLWFGDPSSTDGSLIRGMGIFIEGYGHRVDDAIKDRLRAIPPQTILRRSAARSATYGGGSRANYVARELRRTAGLQGAAKGSKRKRAKA